MLQPAAVERRYRACLGRARGATFERVDAAAAEELVGQARRSSRVRQPVEVFVPFEEPGFGRCWGAVKNHFLMPLIDLCAHRSMQHRHHMRSAGVLACARCLDDGLRMTLLPLTWQGCSCLSRHGTFLGFLRARRAAMGCLPCAGRRGNAARARPCWKGPSTRRSCRRCAQSQSRRRPTRRAG